MVVHGEDGLDEISINEKTTIWELKENTLSGYTITPEELGFHRAKVEEIKGGTTGDNATMIRDVLKSKKGPRRDVVLLNAAASMVAGDIVGNLREGVELAREVIDNGRALHKLQEFIQVSQSFS